METSKNSTPSHEIYHGIPEWLLIEILCKLPSKPLFRCKCASKQFLTLISDPAFVRIYIARASKSRPWTLLTRVAHTQDDTDPFEEIFDLERNLDSSLLMNNYESPTISKLLILKEQWRVEAVSNGLLLCRCELRRDILFNPITKQSIVLPEISQGSSLAFHAHVDQVGGVSYKLARLRMKAAFPTSDHVIEELSSATNKWTSLSAHFSEPFVFTLFFRSFTFKGIFHFFEEYSESACILSYDPARIIRSAGRGSIIWCGEIVQRGGEPTIRCIKLDDVAVIRVWRMKDYEKGTWHLDHKFSQNEILLLCADNKMKPCRKLINIIIHPLEQDLLYFWGQAEGEEFIEGEWMLVSFNVCSRQSRVGYTFSRARNWDDISNMFLLTTPFVLPPWPAILPDPS